MKKIILFISLSVIISMSFAQAIYNNGARIVSTTGSYWVVDNGDFTLTSASPSNLAQMANLTITADASLTLPATTCLTVSGILNNSSGTDGLTLQSNASGSASLIQGNNAVDATRQRYLTGNTSLTAMTYHLVSVPLTPATTSLTELFTGAYVYDFNVADNAWNGLGTSTTTPLDETRGYMVYVPEDSHTYTFAGPMNGGAFTALTTHGGEGYNLVPNPYPSAIDWGASSGWTKTNVNNAVYIWPSGGSNYATYVDGVANNGGAQYIPAGQAFFVKTSASSPVLAMTNEVRVHSNQAFFKAGNELPDVLRILATANGKTDEAVVRFTNQATAMADGCCDAWKMAGSEMAPQLSTSSADNEQLSINSLPYNAEVYTVPVQYSLSNETETTLNFSGIESFDAATTIYLHDLQTGKTTNLRQQQTYSFDYLQSDPIHRFNLLFGGSLSTEELPVSEFKAWVSDNTLLISSQELTGKKAQVYIYNAAGQVMLNKQITLQNMNQIPLQFRGMVLIRIIANEEVQTIKAVLMN